VPSLSQASITEIAPQIGIRESRRIQGVYALTGDDILNCTPMTHEGQSAARVSGACFVMGQAAGTAAACASDTDDFKNQDVNALQQLLIQDACYLELEQIS